MQKTQPHPTDRIATLVALTKKHLLYPNNPIVNSATTEPVIWVDGRDHLLFCSNNLLGLSNHPDVKRAATKALDRYGLGSGGSRQMAANIDVHRALERRIAEFVGQEDAICFATGYMANIGTVPALMKVDFLEAIARIHISGAQPDIGEIAAPGGWEIFSEELNHASLVDGVRLAKAQVKKFPHKSTMRLEELLKSSKAKSKFVLSDGVFSMDGDIAPIPELAALSKEHAALLMIDDAHGVGMLGPNGRGSLEHHGIAPSDVGLQMGTFTKAFGGIGGYVAGRRDVVDFLRITARSYIFSAPLPPAIAAGVTEAIDIADREPWRREKSLENAQYFRREIQALGYDTLGSEAHIVPALIGNELDAGEVTKLLKHRGIIAPHARYPAVPLGRARIRFVMTCQHDREQIDFLLSCMAEVKESLKF